MLPSRALGTTLSSCLGIQLWPHLSASSNTTYSTLCSFKFISTATCTRRPGVAMILEAIHRPGHPRLRPSTACNTFHATLWEGIPEHHPHQQTHMSGFSCRAANWSSILGEKQRRPENTTLLSLSLPSPSPQPSNPTARHGTHTIGMEVRNAYCETPGQGPALDEKQGRTLDSGSLASKVTPMYSAT